MVRAIDESTNVFYVYVENATPSPVNPIAYNVTVKKDDDGKWLLSWMDIVGQNAVFREVRDTDSGWFSKWHKVTTTDDMVYRFDFLSKKVYDTCVRKLIPAAPDLKDDDAVQTYFKKSHLEY